MQACGEETPAKVGTRLAAEFPDEVGPGPALTERPKAQRADCTVRRSTGNTKTEIKGKDLHDSVWERGPGGGQLDPGGGEGRRCRSHPSPSYRQDPWGPAWFPHCTFLPLLIFNMGTMPGDCTQAGTPEK